MKSVFNENLYPPNKDIKFKNKILPGVRTKNTEDTFMQFYLCDDPHIGHCNKEHYLQRVLFGLSFQKFKDSCYCRFTTLLPFQLTKKSFGTILRGIVLCFDYCFDSNIEW